jgi:hypothetical protein
VPIEKFKTLTYKWQNNLFATLRDCLQSKEHVLVSNALLVSARGGRAGLPPQPALLLPARSPP